MTVKRIVLVRERKVLMDSDLAALYGVTTKRLNEQVRRNASRFPLDFVFQVSNQELDNLRSQIATSSWGGRRYPPYAFTEHGAIMQASAQPMSIALKDRGAAMNNAVLPSDRIESRIFLIRGQKVMLDETLAELYEVEVKVLNQAVKRNIERFPDDFMLRITAEEAGSLRSQFVTLKVGRGRHRKYLPYAFTEQGVAMLSTVLRSKRAVMVNIEIMRAFVRLRQILASNAELSRKLEALEKKYDSQFKVVFDAIRQLMAPAEANKRSIGFVS